MRERESDGERKGGAGKGRLRKHLGDFVHSFSGRQRRQYTFLFFRRISRSQCMIHISKDPSVPIRKNVTFIPFRIGGTAGLVYISNPTHGDCHALAQNQTFGVGSGTGNKNTILPLI